MDGFFETRRAEDYEVSRYDNTSENVDENPRTPRELGEGDYSACGYTPFECDLLECLTNDRDDADGVKMVEENVYSDVITYKEALKSDLDIFTASAVELAGHQELKQSTIVRDRLTLTESKTNIGCVCGQAAVEACMLGTGFSTDPAEDKRKRYSCPPIVQVSPSHSVDSRRTLVDSAEQRGVSGLRCSVAFEASSKRSEKSYWTKIHAADTEAKVEELSTNCLMAVSYQDMLYQETIVSQRSDLAAMEIILSARDVELANLEEDHEAIILEAEALRNDLEEAEVRYTAQSKMLQHANTKARIADKATDSMRWEYEGLKAGKAALERELKQEQSKNANLVRQNKSAALDVGFFAVQNAFYRHEMEDSDPARTALFDGILQRKEEAIIRLEGDLEACHTFLAEEKKGRAAEKAKAVGQIEELRQELEDRRSALEAICKSRTMLQEQYDAIADMFKSKIYHEDAVKAICDSHDMINQDNTSLIGMLQKRDNALQVASEKASSARAEIIELNYIIEVAKQKQAQLEGENSCLVRRVDELVWKGELHDQASHVMTEAHESNLRDVKEENKQLQQTIDHLLNTNLNHTANHILVAKNQEIRELQETLERTTSTCNQFYNELLELGGINGRSFSYWTHHMEIQDWKCEDMKRRLKFAEGMMVHTQAKHAQEVVEKGPLRVWMEMYGGCGIGEKAFRESVGREEVCTNATE